MRCAISSSAPRTYKPKIGSDLVVARTPRMQSLARVADQLGQSLFDIQMDIFEIERPDELVAFDFAADGRHAVFDRSEIRGRKHAHRGEHPRMRQRTRNIDSGETAIEVYRCGVALDQIGNGLAEAPGPALRDLRIGIGLVDWHACLTRVSSAQ